MIAWVFKKFIMNDEKEQLLIIQNIVCEFPACVTVLLFWNFTVET